jgi:hypothetical protein
MPTSSRLKSTCNSWGGSRLEKRAATLAIRDAGSVMARAIMGSMLP